MDDADLRALRADERELGIAFYESQGYGGGIADGDAALGAWQAGRLVGLVRLVQEQGLRILRGMFIDASCQRRGLGTRMLDELVQDLHEACWLVCPDRLNGFYAHVGFQPVASADSPPHIVTRMAKYQETTSSTMNVLRRPASQTGSRSR